ncbi:MAG: type II toxin-antitoxin system HicA family toxin [Chloroflexi bacterium]|nr:type II toxin-antitoxin system HicA family toxin [Chloroflexota bacterium]
MSKLPRGLSGQEVVKALNKAGFYFKRRKGSHIILRRDVPFALVVVPDHRNIDTGTLDHIIEGADITVADFIKLLK